MAPTSLLSLATALPSHAATTASVGRFLSNVAREQPGGGEKLAHKIRRVLASTQIDRRYSVLPDFLAESPEDFTFFPKAWDLEPFPSTKARMAVYAREAVPLAATAAERALERAGVAAKNVSHLIVSSCTGFFAPGPEVMLVERLGLLPTVSRTLLGFMGCYAGLTGMRLADTIVRADPKAVVLQIGVELCTLHYQKVSDLRRLLPSLLFGDGAGAAVYAAQTRAPGIARVLGGATRIAPSSADAMTWQIGDHGFEMTLAAEVPAALESSALPFVAELLEPHGLNRDKVRGWAIHPGGRSIVEAVGRALGLGAPELEPSLSTLAAIGNVSSATIFFVLERMLSAGRRPTGPIVGLGFGPGLTMDGVVIDHGRAL